jgi:glycosyltransferase involved in cell wall biosynthesis
MEVLSNRTAVCIIVENLPVPFDRRVWQEARALRDAGYSVSVISPKGRGFDRSRETSEGIEIRRYPIWEASGPLGYFMEYVWALAATFFLAIGLYTRTRFRALQACNPPDTLFLIGLFFKLFGVRFIFDHHDLNPELYEVRFGNRGLIYKLVCLAERLTFHTADVCIAANQSFREIALARGHMPPERVFIVRSSPELQTLDRNSLKPELKQGREYLVVYVGVMGRQDGVDLLLESLLYFSTKDQRQDTLFAVIGSGTELPRLKALARQKRLDSLIQFTGPLYGATLHAYLSTADVCVAPDPANVFNHKLTMNKILEYMAFGKPVVLYDLVEGRRSAGDCALYSRPNDPADFAEQICKLLESEALRHRLGECGRRRIEETLNWEHDKKTLLEAYRAALSGSLK